VINLDIKNEDVWQSLMLSVHFSIQQEHSVLSMPVYI